MSDNMCEHGGLDGNCLRCKDATITRLEAEIAKLKGEVERLNAWVNDLQSGMYINCVYCGHRYGPKDKVPCTMANALKQHIEQCPKHPMSALKKSLAAAKQENERLIRENEEWKRESNKYPTMAEFENVQVERDDLKIRLAAALERERELREKVKMEISYANISAVQKDWLLSQILKGGGDGE